MHPLFFSVSSDPENIQFAEHLWAQFPDDWVYLYTKTGEDGVHMWDEISSQELPKSQIIVVFWSEAFSNSSGCIRELSQAKELVQGGRLQPLVLRLDDYPITWTEEISADKKPIFDNLKQLLDFRTSSPNITREHATELVRRVAEPFLRSDHPQLPREDIKSAIRKAMNKDRFKIFPAIWLSGFNGVGRETLVRSITKDFAPNSRVVVIEVNEASLPKQVLLKIESEAFGADIEALAQLQETELNNEPLALAQAIQRVFEAGDTLVFRHTRIVEEKVDLPEWLNDVVNDLDAKTRPMVYVISQAPLLKNRRLQCQDHIAGHRIPTVDEYQMTDFVYQLIGHFDEQPERWTDTEIASVVNAAAGTLGFLVTLVRLAANLTDLDQLRDFITDQKGRMDKSMTLYISWATSELRKSEDTDALRCLLFLNDVSPCDMSDLEQIIQPARPMIRVLGRLVDLGLVEIEGEGLYRLTPLISNRLSTHLLDPDLREWLKNAYGKLVTAPIEVDDGGHEYLKIETRIQAAMWSGSDDLPENVRKFVSAAHWFQAGVRLYHARRREEAYRLLKRAYDQRSEFTTTSRNELIRYYCLSATRTRRFDEADAAIQLLENVHTTKGMAIFLRADKLEYQRKFIEAVQEYERSLKLNQGMNARLERTYRPLVRCILAANWPNFVKAEKYALASLGIRETIFSLMTLARVYLHWKYEGPMNTRYSVPDDLGQRYQDALVNVKNDPGGEGAYYRLKAEEASFERDWPAAVDHLEKAIEADPRFEVRAERWRLMARSEGTDLPQQAITELEQAKQNPEYRNFWPTFLPGLAQSYALALKNSGQPTAKVNTFAPELTAAQLGGIITQAR